MIENTFYVFALLMTFLTYLNIFNLMDKQTFDIERSKSFITKIYDQSVVPALCQFIKIPNLSRGFDSEWATNGLLEKAANLIKTWVQGLDIKGLKSEIIKHQGYSPLIFTQIEGDIKDRTIMFYGHFDKQPPMVGWDQGKGPTIPVIQNDKLYGRGGADDGYSTFCSMLAVKAVQEQGLPIPRIVMITEGDEETGGHIDYYMEKLRERIGNPEVIFCLDSGTLDYEHLWTTSSLRGFIAGLLKVKVLTEGVHSGDASGVVPSSFRILNMLLARLENRETGQINKKFQVDIPPNRYKEAYDLVKQLKEQAVKEYPFFKNTQQISSNFLELVLNRTWKAQLAITGATGLPPAQTSGNVMLPQCQVRVSLRCPPTLNAHQKLKELKELLTSNPPYGAEVTFENGMSGNGWNCPDYQPWLQNALSESAQQYFGNELLGQGEGGSIPLMGLLSQYWPKAQFIVTGVLGPLSNAHGPNEFMHIPYTRKITQAMAHVLARASETK